MAVSGNQRRSIFGGLLIGEVEHRGDNSEQTQDQFNAFNTAAQEDPSLSFDVEYVDDSDDNGL